MELHTTPAGLPGLRVMPQRSGNHGVETARLVTLGATEVAGPEGHGTSWSVRLDPEGNECCLDDRSEPRCSDQRAIQAGEERLES
jgi:hypothetical protein